MGVGAGRRHQFAFIKATEGGDHIDPRFLENWHGAAQAGVPRGAYHFMYWCRPAHEQAAWFRRNVPNDPNALPPVLDLEWNGHSRTCPKKLPRETALEKIQLMLKEMEAHTGKRPIIYTDITFHKEVLEGELARLSALGAQRRRRAARALPEPPVDHVAVHHDRPRARHRAATSTATPSTAARPSGRSSSPPTATPATTRGSRRRACATGSDGAGRPCPGSTG